MTNDARGPDYADELTGEEQRVLDRVLRARLRPEPAPDVLTTRLLRLVDAAPDEPATRPRRVPWLAAAAAAAVLLTAGLLPRLAGGPTPTPPTPPAAARTVDALLEEAAAAAARQPGAAGDPPFLHRERLDVTVTDRSAGCTVDAVRSRVRVPATGAPPAVDSGRLVVTRVDASTFDPARTGCPRPTPAAPAGPLFTGPSPDVGARWATSTGLAPSRYVAMRSVARLFGVADVRSDAPDEPAAVARRLDKWCRSNPRTDCAAIGWMVTVAVLTSPETTGPQRAAALRAMARTDAGVRVLAVESTDLTGRSGVALRVPYVPQSVPPVDGVPTGSAELILDTITGALRQRRVAGPGGSGAEITVFLAAGAAADDDS